MTKQQNDDWINVDPRPIHGEITRWIAQEHTLLSSRMGWLVSANAFLFTPVVILLGGGADPDMKRIVLRTICFLGVVLAFLLAVPMTLAVHTMHILRKRYEIFLGEVKAKKEFHFADPERNITNHSWPQRLSGSHNISMAFQLCVPLTILAAWIWLLCLLWNTGR